MLFVEEVQRLGMEHAMRQVEEYIIENMPTAHREENLLDRRQHRVQGFQTEVQESRVSIVADRREGDELIHNSANNRLDDQLLVRTQARLIPVELLVLHQSVEIHDPEGDIQRNIYHSVAD